MKNCKNYILTGCALILVLITGPGISFAQINRGGSPWSFNLTILQPRSGTVVVAPPDLDALMEEDFLKPVPYRFAANLNIDVGIQAPARKRDPGSWITLPSGDIMWLCTIHAPGAKALTLYFDRFSIPSGGRLFLYNSDKSVVLGAFTDLNNNSAQVFSTSLVPGDQVTLEYDQPAQTSGFPDLHISEIAYAYRGIHEQDDMLGFGSSGSCEVNVACQEGNSWQNQQKGIARIGVKKNGGTYWCSGSLLNNARQDFRPYFLTADHCGTGANPQDFNQWIFYFGYQSSTCPDPLVEPGYRSMTGASVLAASGDVYVKGSDFLLLLLNQTIPDTFDVWFNGWNREDTASQSGVGIHHPQGDIKKISTYTTPLISASWNGQVAGTHWLVTWSGTSNGHGVTEGGSSGSPILDSDGRIVGTLTGGDSSCDSVALDLPDYYGKFSYSWDLCGTDSTERLDVWLDPDQTGVVLLDGIALTIPEQENTPAGLTLFPNPVSSILHVTSNAFLNQARFRITMVDSWGRPVRTETIPGNGTGRFTLDVSSLPNGFYLLRVYLDEQVFTGRIIKL